MLVALIGSLCRMAMAAEKVDARPQGEDRLVAAANRLAVDLYKGVAEAAANDRRNVVLSPYCSFESLFLLREAAGGQTAAALGKLLGSSGDAKEDPTLLRGARDLVTGKNAKSDALICNVANALWLDHGVKADKGFLDIVQKDLGAEVREADLGGSPEAVCKEINAWVARQTREKIKDLCSPIDLVGRKAEFVSAIYFHGKWVHPFEEDSTRDSAFSTEAAKQVRVKMMERKAVSDYYHGDGVQVTGIPYYTNEPYEGVAYCQFYIILPDDPRGLAKLEASLDAATLKRWITASHPTQEAVRAYFARQPAEGADEAQVRAWADGLPMKEVTLHLPRFGTETRLWLDGALKRAGAGEALGPGSDFSRLGAGVFRMEDVLQVARIDVDEKGTEAAAAQQYGLFGGASGAPVTVTVDHPFLYVIRESNTGLILFMGRVADPTTH
jgi:serpin B